MDNLLKELGNSFELNGKELLIIESITKGPLEAQQISKKTGIPKGRIYEHLNNLLRIKLIDRSEKKPYRYSIENLDNNIIDFLKYNFDDMVQKQHRIMHILEHKTRGFDEIEIVGSGNDFSFRIIQLLKESRTIKNILRHGSVPFLLYPEKASEYARVRKMVVENRDIPEHTTPEMTFMLYQAHMDSYKKDKNTEYIVEASAIKLHFNLIKEKFGEEYLKKTISEIKDRIKKYNLKIGVLEEFIPMQIFITDSKVFLSIVHLNNTHGIIIRNKAAVNLYTEYFDDMNEKCRPMEKYLNKLR
ncbi:ArsR family transcriptional regulator [Candidatus Woesearchaeota archaeon]|nr:ArsR family transcriptional regulator [Candidatus Woesearchaeota archaeon]